MRTRYVDPQTVAREKLFHFGILIVHGDINYRHNICEMVPKSDTRLIKIKPLIKFYSTRADAISRLWFEKRRQIRRTNPPNFIDRLRLLRFLVGFTTLVSLNYWTGFQVLRRHVSCSTTHDVSKEDTRRVVMPLYCEWENDRKIPTCGTCVTEVIIICSC